jgi:predicted TIM-barrel fold metal-dependent hydrolase
MARRVISADGHLDLPWMPPDLFTANASAKMRERMPYVEERADGLRWVSRSGADFGLVNGMGSAGRRYVPGQIHRSDRMAAQGLYADGAKGIRRLTTPELRIKDQDLDGICGEVLYGILGAAKRLDDPQASTEMLHIYNEWLAEFCASHPHRFAGIACIPGHDMDAAVREIQAVARRGVVRGIEVPITTEMQPLFDAHWEPLWRAASEARLPVHLHTIGQPRPDWSHLPALQQRQAFAVHITSFQMAMARPLMEAIYGGVFVRHPEMILVLGESGIGWIPYVLDHMDLEWQDQFKDLELTMKPSEYWRRNCRATYQSDPVGIRCLDLLGEDNVMWGSDFPHPDGVWPDSQEFLARELAGLGETVRSKIVFENAARLYGFPV